MAIERGKYEASDQGRLCLLRLLGDVDRDEELDYVEGVLEDPGNADGWSIAVLKLADGRTVEFRLLTDWKQGNKTNEER